MALVLTVGGSDVSKFIDFHTVKVQDSVEIKGDTLDFRMWVYENEILPPKGGAEVIFRDGLVREFAGVVVDVTTNLLEGTHGAIYTLQCMDYTYYLDRRYINKIYTEQAADAMIKEILGDLKTAADNESADGDQHYTDFNSDLSEIETASVKCWNIYNLHKPLI